MGPPLIGRVSRQLRVLGREIGAGSVSMYALRHTFAFRFISCGGNVESLRLICGHGPGNWKVLSTLKQRFECAVRDQARIENDWP